MYTDACSCGCNSEKQYSGNKKLNKVYKSESPSLMKGTVKYFLKTKILHAIKFF